ncbi:uncharacterized protein H6S33_001408 [Morchella sextelata]|uniref:uncharacterized protein n=1 Tax=Morchella sextelata TaxID=1174677 RepID=UPI001D037B6D|nr:uncharacterized protein H6S33_001408 [Morchella sextelata]KAH0609180.1 hypothetical protein H6S33_001408 [Morchella sextelata]
MSDLPLHIALHLVPYLTPRDIARCQKVCRSWHATFTCPSLLSAALRTHFPRAYEVRTRAIQNPSSFSTISARYNALQSGIPQQELHFPIKKSRRDAYIWTFSSDLLVFQSSHYPKATLSLVYFDPTPGGRKVKSGKIELEDPARPVVRLKVCSDVLVVERSEEVIEMGRSRFFTSTECYRLNYCEDGDEVKAAMMCTIDTFEFLYIDYSYQVLSDLSRYYYAAYSRSYSRSSLGGERQLCVWNVATGDVVKTVPSGSLEGMGLTVELLLIGDKVVVVGDDKRNNNFRRWRHYQGDWGYISHFRVFDIVNDSPKDPVGGFVGRKKAECPKESKISTTPFKVSRRAEEEEEEVAIILWELEDKTNNATAHHYTLATSTSSPSSPDLINSPLAPTYQYRLDQSNDPLSCLDTPTDSKKTSPFVVKSKEALSFDMDFTGQNEEFLDTRLMLYHLRIQSFYPSADVPGVMELDWETKLKDRDDEKRARKIYSTDRNVSYRNIHVQMDVAGDERMSAFLELTVTGMELVMVVWDQPFKIGA